MTTCSKIQQHSEPVDGKLYRSIIGKLHYLSLTRPDVGFKVSKLSQLCITHINAIGHHLKGCYGISSTHEPTGYSFQNSEIIYSMPIQTLTGPVIQLATAPPLVM